MNPVKVLSSEEIASSEDSYYWRIGATCDVSPHTEIAVRMLLEIGHDVRVFAPMSDSANKD